MRMITVDSMNPDTNPAPPGEAEPEAEAGEKSGTEDPKLKNDYKLKYEHCATTSKHIYL
jgi:hypothetical protein